MRVVVFANTNTVNDHTLEASRTDVFVRSFKHDLCAASRSAAATDRRTESKGTRRADDTHKHQRYKERVRSGRPASTITTSTAERLARYKHCQCVSFGFLITNIVR